MTIGDDDQLRAWSLDYALRLHPKDEVVTPEQVIVEAKKFHRYMTNAPSAKRLKLVRNTDTKK